MKQTTKKILQATLSLLFSVCLIGGLSTMFSSEETSPLTAYAVNDVESLAVTITPEYFAEYGMGETIAINNFETETDGKITTLYAVLQKDYEVFALLTPEMKQITYEFAEVGTYNLVYYTQASDGRKTVVKNICFSVGNQPYIDVVFEAEYMVNQTLSMQADCVFGNKKTTATVSVKSPTGKDVEIIDFSAKINRGTMS